MRTALLSILVGTLGLSAAGCYVHRRDDDRARWEERHERRYGYYHDRDHDGYRDRDPDDRVYVVPYNR